MRFNLYGGILGRYALVWSRLTPSESIRLSSEGARQVVTVAMKRSTFEPTRQHVKARTIAHASKGALQGALARIRKVAKVLKQTQHLIGGADVF